MSTRTPRNWIAIASAEHARLGRDHRPIGFMQVGHGKGAPLTRVAPGDRVAYYAPATVYGGTDRLQSFVSIGVVQPGEPYQVDMGRGFIPWRRDVRYAPAQEAPIAPLIEAFDFVEDPKRWGSKFRFGLFEINDHDMQLIATAMRADALSQGL
ncbi:EVE domain-containing protein [Variovorax sp. J22G21]|uniref:EVE domain-containing protein n=1 Tax=Variovorax fucosicus TaxID=3053517 RepID=UPI002576A633|nr:MULTISPECIES: EVE domain-containing protein [unclassified Variovorax]MDM0040617.1 EVE domain-containing protein [Variovorax sp. J22R193]MDM0061990.1 EVE domain-containing protein [Variovorax sp. J22G21]